MIKQQYTEFIYLYFVYVYRSAQRRATNTDDMKQIRGLLRTYFHLGHIGGRNKYQMKIEWENDLGWDQKMIPNLNMTNQTKTARRSVRRITPDLYRESLGTCPRGHTGN